MKAKIILIGIFVFILLTVGLVFLFRYLVRRTSERKVEAYLQDFAGKHYAEVQNIYKDMRGWRHDYHNQLQTMMACIELEQYDLLKQHLNNLDSDLRKVDTILKTGNVMADAILNSKLSMAKSKDIKIDATATVPKELTVSDVDLCVVLGNLLDNATESCMKIEDKEERFIRLYIGTLKGQLYISVTNSANGVKKSAGEYITSKAGFHGYGLKRIDGIVEKYNGYKNRQDEGDVFATELMLPL